MIINCLLQKVINEFPYVEVIEYSGSTITVIVEETAEGWIVHSPTCLYKLEYFPRSHRRQLRLSLGKRYQGRTFGICQDFNGDAADDNMDCSRPPKPADLMAIGQSCSCLITDESCNEALGSP